MSSDIKKTIKRAALRFLARREYADSELHSRLIRAGFAADDIAVVLASLLQANLLSNVRFIENYIHFRRQKGFGPLRIASELYKKGLKSEEYTPFLQENDATWLDDIRVVWETRFKKQMPDDFATQAKQMRFLQARGFTGEQIQFLFKNQPS